MSRERTSSQRLEAIYRKCQEIELRRSSHSNQHPYAIFYDEEKIDLDCKENFIIFQAKDMNNESYNSVIENMFSLYGDVKQVYYDSRFENYYFVEFEDSSGVEEAIEYSKRKRIAIQGVPINVYRVRKQAKRL